MEKFVYDDCFLKISLIKTFVNDWKRISNFTDMFITKVVNIQDWRATNPNVMHSVLKAKFFY